MDHVVKENKTKLVFVEKFVSTKTRVSIDLFCPRSKFENEDIEGEIEDKFLFWKKKHDRFVDSYSVRREYIPRANDMADYFGEANKVSLSIHTVGDCSGMIEDFYTFAKERGIEIHVIHEQSHKPFEEEEELPF